MSFESKEKKKPTTTTEDEILIEDFTNPINKWNTQNDPVMGGKSYSEVTIKDGVARFTGKCAIVPFLKAPGFVKMETGGWLKPDAAFPDVSTCSGLKFSIRTHVKYDGYRISFGNVHVPGGRFARGYKAPALTNVPYKEFGDLEIPFSSFSSKWDDATGDIQVTCSDDPQYCPSTEWLRNMKTMSFWGEGVEGKVDLEIQTIHAIGCASSAEEPVLSMTLPAHYKNDTSTTSASFVGMLIGLLVVGIAAIKVVGFYRRRRNVESKLYEEIPNPPVEDRVMAEL